MTYLYYLHMNCTYEQSLFIYIVFIFCIHYGPYVVCVNYAIGWAISTSDISKMKSSSSGLFKDAFINMNSLLELSTLYVYYLNHANKNHMLKLKESRKVKSNMRSEVTAKLDKANEVSSPQQEKDSNDFATSFSKLNVNITSSTIVDQEENAKVKDVVVDDEDGGQSDVTSETHILTEISSSCVESITTSWTSVNSSAVGSDDEEGGGSKKDVKLAKGNK